MKKIERQIHGFMYEKFIINKYSLIVSEKYTSKFDAYTKSGVPVQIKCIKEGNCIDLGDFKRNQSITSDFILILGRWRNKKNKIVDEKIFHIDYKLYNELCTFDHTNKMLEEMKAISNDVSDDNIWLSFCKKYRCIYPQSNIIKLRFKRDHKKQKRIQCGMSETNYRNIFCKKFKKLENLNDL